MIKPIIVESKSSEGVIDHSEVYSVSMKDHFLSSSFEITAESQANSAETVLRIAGSLNASKIYPEDRLFVLCHTSNLFTERTTVKARGITMTGTETDRGTLLVFTNLKALEAEFDIEVLGFTNPPSTRPV